MALNFDLPAGERTQRPGSPVQIRPASRPPRKKFAPKQYPVSTVHTAGGLGSRGGRLAGCPKPPARSTAATGAPGGLPPNFLSSRADKTRGDRAVEVANVHARASNRRAKRKLDIPNIVAADLPPKKPNLPPDRKTMRFTPESIPQGELTLVMQPQPLAEVHPFVPTLRKWQQGIPVDCGPDWEKSVIEAAVDRGPHPTAHTSTCRCG